MRLVRAHCKWMLKELFRQPSYVVSTIGFPSLFFLIFGVPEATNAQRSHVLVASFSGFAVFGVIFLQFGTALAEERSKSWYYYLRTLPVSPRELFMARVLCATLFSILASSCVMLVAALWTYVQMTFSQWTSLFAMLWLGGLLFFPMGLILGALTTPKTALPVGNLFYLVLSFAGGLWMPPSILPEVVQSFSEKLPTRHFGEILWAITSGSHFPWVSFRYLVVFFCISLGLAWFLVKRDSKERGSV